MSDFRKAFDVQHPIFRPLWVRVLIVALCFGWTAFEATNGNTLWGILFGTAGVYLAYQFFWAFKLDDDNTQE